VTLAVTGNTISGRVSRRCRMTVCQWHRLPLREVDKIYSWLVTVERRLTLCVFPVFSVAVMEKCCDACGDGEYYFRSGFSTLQVDGVSEASSAVDRKSMSIGWLVTVERRLTLCVFPVFSVAVMEKCCDACGDGEYYFRSRFRRFGMTVCQRHRLPLTGSRPDLRLVSYSGKTPTLCVFPVFCVAVMEKCCDACGDGEYYFRSEISTITG
jgi:nitrate reductase NapE component